MEWNYSKKKGVRMKKGMVGIKGRDGIKGCAEERKRGRKLKNKWKGRNT